jgi:hypothetical protein
VFVLSQQTLPNPHSAVRSDLFPPSGTQIGHDRDRLAGPFPLLAASVRLYFCFKQHGRLGDDHCGAHWRSVSSNRPTNISLRHWFPKCGAHPPEGGCVCVQEIIKGGAKGAKLFYSLKINNTQV